MYPGLNQESGEAEDSSKITTGRRSWELSATKLKSGVYGLFVDKTLTSGIFSLSVCVRYLLVSFLFLLSIFR